MRLLAKHNRMIQSDLLALVMIAVSVVIVHILFHPQKAVFLDHDPNLEAGWITMDGRIVALDDLPVGDVTVTHDLTGIDLYGKCLCFKSNDTHITAICDGREIYRYAPQQPAILGRSYGMYVHMIRIPEEAQSVTLLLHPVYEGMAAFVQDVAVEETGAFVSSIYRDHLPEFTLCAMIALFGVLMLILGFSTWKTRDSSNVNFFSLGTFSILVGIWSANDTYIVQVYTQRPEMMRFINYLCLIFIAYLPVSIMAKATNCNQPWMLRTIFGLTIIDFVVTIVLSALGISDVRMMLPFTHFNIWVALFMTIYMMIRAVRKKTVEKTFLRAVNTGMTIAAASVVLDMVRFQLSPNSRLGTSAFTRMGVLILVLLIGFQLIRERTRLAVEQSRNELMKKMAYTDGLTGIANRSAFHEKEGEIRDGGLDCTIIQLDINFLKKVNDMYGHAEGDRHIRQAASVINQCFDGLGTCFRTGGDEFIVIAERGSNDQIESALTKMEELIDGYNAEHKTEIPLQLAYGYARYDHQSGILEVAEKLADERMYKKKRAMKDAGCE